MQRKLFYFKIFQHNLLSIRNEIASRGMKTYSESRSEMRNLQILNKMLEKSSQFLSSGQPCEPKSSDVALSIAGVEKNTLRNLAIAVNTGGQSIRVLNERSVRDGENLCPLWLVILKSV